jgi:ADP-ribose pyrophosphatase YjhB (NUDIX family)
MDLTFKTNGGYFIYKVGAIIIHENKLLMVKNENFSFYYVVGGRAQLGETSEAAVLREVYEETGVNFEIDRLACIHENFFDDSESAFDAPCHEIALYYLMKESCDIEKVKCKSVGHDGGKESLFWLPIDELSSFHMFPEFLKTELKNLQNGFSHFITKNGNTHKVEW